MPATSGSRFLELEEQGFYEVRPPGTNPERPFAVAVNVDVTESELETMDPTELAAAVAPREGGVGMGQGAEMTPEMQARNQERRQSLWRLLMVAGLVLLLAETAISNWISRETTMRFDDRRSYVPSST